MMMDQKYGSTSMVIDVFDPSKREHRLTIVITAKNRPWVFIYPHVDDQRRTADRKLVETQRCPRNCDR